MTIEEEPDDYLNDNLIHAWENYRVSGHPKHLANFIEMGGDIGDDPILRKHLVYIIRNHAPKPRGNSDRLRDVAVYDRVEWWMSTIWHHSHPMHHSLPRNKRPSLQDAFRDLTADDPEANIEAFQKQYERGRKIKNPTNKE